MCRVFWFSIVSALAGFAISGASTARADEATQLSEIVVTAERHASSVQATPLAITALSGDTLRNRQINSIDELNTLVPGLDFGSYVGNAEIAIRGVSSEESAPGTESRTAVYRDNIYFSRPSSALLNFYDVDRVEVLRGPQGTLYGRNATGGAINIISRQPTSEVEGYARLTAGNYGLVGAEGAVSGPLSPVLSGRISSMSNDRSGFGTDLATGKDIDDLHARSVRGQLRFAPYDRLTLHAWAQYDYENDSAGATKGFGRGYANVPDDDELLGEPAHGIRDIDGQQPINKREVFSSGLDLNWSLADALTLVSQTGYIDSDTRLIYGRPDTRQNRPEHSNEVTQELRLQGNAGPVTFVLGSYFFQERLRGRVWTNVAVPAIDGGAWTYGTDVGGNETTDAYAGFGQMDWHLDQQFTLTLGGRYSYERKRVAEFAITALTPYAGSIIYGPLRSPTYHENHGDWSSFDPKATLTWQPTGDVMAYLTYSRGFKSGGFTLGALQPSFQPEHLANTEAGVKVEAFHRHLRLNVAAFHYDYTNLQVQQYVNNLVEVENAAGSKIDGLEVEMRARPLERLDLGVNVALLHARFTNYRTLDSTRPRLGILDLSGNHLAQAPDYVFTFDGGYTIPIGPGDLTLHADVTFKDRIYFSPFNVPSASQAPYGVGNASLLYAWGGNWEALAFVKNVTNTLYYQSKVIGPGLLGNLLGGAVGNPRTFGLTVTRHFQ